ncbi:MAG TPA: hypothetical protein EYP59_21640 [Thiotrichaceae bacterium]|nr:hypothetical protein [Thiotrichaceae bacterium]
MTVEKSQVTSVRDALGNETHFTYDKSGNKLTEKDPLGNTVTYTYDENGNQLTESRKRTDASGNQVVETTFYEYDKRNRLIQSTDAFGNINKTEYNTIGQKVARIDALERQTEYRYDTYGNLAETRYPDGTKETRTFDVEGNILSVTDVAGQTTRYEYDKLNRQIKVISPNDNVTQTEYDATGNVIAEIDATGNRIEFKYNKAGRRILTKNAYQEITSFGHDPSGNVVLEVNANNSRFSFEHDAFDQRTKTLYPGNISETFSYDATGRLVSDTDLSGHETQYEYDALGRLIKVIQFQNDKQLTTTFAYDEAGNLISQTDANQNTTTWTYDKLGRVLSRTLPLGMTETFVYENKTGHLISHTDFNKQTSTYQYDPKNGRLLSIMNASGQTRFTYDVVGNRKTMTDSHGTTTYRYDNRYRLIKEVKPNQVVLEYGYNKAGNLTSFKFTPPKGAAAQVQYQYDALNRLKKVIAPDGETTYHYDKLGNQEKVSYANGTYTNYNYDPLSRLTSLETRKPDNSLLASYQYSLLPTGQRTRVSTHTGRVVNYRYDDVYRLKEEKIETASHDILFSYQYDAVGNRIYSIEDGVHTKYSYDTNDRLLKQGGTTYQYDANGNTLRIEKEGHVVGLSYDSNDRLIRVTTEVDGQATSTVSYAYDAEGNRVQTNADGEITQYVVDSNFSMPQVIAELDKDNQVNVAYLYGDDLISQYRGNEIRYYHYDGLGSTRTLTDQNATPTDTYDYEAFGELLEETGETENNYRYTGEQLDPNTGDYYLRARYYDPSSGRFLSMDSFNGVNQDPITLHKYLYANADPVNMIDPTGYFSLGSVSASNNISGILNTMNRIDNFMDILDFATDPTGALTNRARGSAVLLGRLGKNAGKLMRPFNKMCREKKKSFTGNTLVHTKRGLVPISKVKIGDLVLSYDEKTTQTQYNEVLNLIQGEQEYTIVTLTLENGELIEATDNHPFYIQGKGWNPASSLKVGQALQLHNGTLVVIEEVLTSVRPEKVYNLTVANAHTYFVGKDGVLGHNAIIQLCDVEEYKREAQSQVTATLDGPDPNAPLSKSQRNRRFGSGAIVAAFHIVTGDIVVSTSQSGRLYSIEPLHEQMEIFANLHGGIGSNNQIESHNLGGCAEFSAANQLLNELKGTGLDYLALIGFTFAYRPKTRILKPPCTYCQPLPFFVYPETKKRIRECLSGLDINLR